MASTQRKTEAQKYAQGFQQKSPELWMSVNICVQTILHFPLGLWFPVVIILSVNLKKKKQKKIPRNVVQLTSIKLISSHVVELKWSLCFCCCAAE